MSGVCSAPWGERRLWKRVSEETGKVAATLVLTPAISRTSSLEGGPFRRHRRRDGLYGRFQDFGKPSTVSRAASTAAFSAARGSWSSRRAHSRWEFSEGCTKRPFRDTVKGPQDPETALRASRAAGRSSWSTSPMKRTLMWRLRRVRFLSSSVLPLSQANFRPACWGTGTAANSLGLGGAFPAGGASLLIGVTCLADSGVSGLIGAPCRFGAVRVGPEWPFGSLMLYVSRN
jgi:hypothetical protein